MSTLTTTLASYVPALITDRLVDHPAPLTAPSSERFSAAVLFADIFGFTSLTERLTNETISFIKANKETTPNLENVLDPWFFVCLNDSNTPCVTLSNFNKTHGIQPGDNINNCRVYNDSQEQMWTEEGMCSVLGYNPVKGGSPCTNV